MCFKGDAAGQHMSPLASTSGDTASLSPSAAFSRPRPPPSLVNRLAALARVCPCALAGVTPPPPLARRGRGERSYPLLAPRRVVRVVASGTHLLLPRSSSPSSTRACCGCRRHIPPLAPRRCGTVPLLPARLTFQCPRSMRALLSPAWGRRCSSSSRAAAGIPTSSCAITGIPASSSAVVGSFRVTKKVRLYLYPARSCLKFFNSIPLCVCVCAELMNMLSL
jgi:hypothetical protein